MVPKLKFSSKLKISSVNVTKNFQQIWSHLEQKFLTDNSIFCAVFSSWFADTLTDSFLATGLFLYPLKISEKLWFPDVFRGYRKRVAA